jgi:hypothetical protein
VADRYQSGARRAWLCVAGALTCLELAAACGGHGAKIEARTRVFERVTATAADRFELELGPSVEVTFEAGDASAGADAVLHLWDVARRSEVARGEASVWLDRGARLSYRNPFVRPRRYLLFVRARTRDAYGRVDVYRDGRRLRRARVGGTLLEVASGRGYSYQVAAAPGGLTTATLYALDASGRLLGYDERSGPTGMPKLSGLDAVHELLVTPASDTTRGTLSVYANDGEDGDGDGLGRALERALGTCDGPREPGCRSGPLAGYYRAMRDGTRDTDRDGLEDSEELFGVAAEAGALDLPRFGADPRHKDVFVEVDRQARVEGPGLDEHDIAEIASLFAAGSADDLRNPDHLPGVRLHLDIGGEPRERGHLGLFGDWGGSNRVEHSDYKQAREHDFTPSRRR